MKTIGSLRDAGEVHRLVGVAARGRAFAEPADARRAPRSRIRNASAHADRHREHRRQMADHRDQTQAWQVRHVDVAVPALRRSVGSRPMILREDPPRLDAARDVDAHVAVRAACRRRPAPIAVATPTAARLVPAARVEGAGDLALLVEDVAALLDPARDQHVAVDGEEVVAVETRLPHLGQRPDRSGFARDRHEARTVTERRRARDRPRGGLSLHGNGGLGSRM